MLIFTALHPLFAPVLLGLWLLIKKINFELILYLITQVIARKGTLEEDALTFNIWYSL